jgi:hypothetical protein
MLTGTKVFLGRQIHCNVTREHMKGIAKMQSAALEETTTTVAVAWNYFLSLVSAINLCIWLAVALRSSSEPPLELSWNGVWKLRRVLALAYVLACGVRSVFPRVDGARVCMWDHPLSPPLVGRSLAFAAELCFVGMVCMTLVRVIHRPAARYLARAAFTANVIAQLSCTYAVITRDQRGHVLEELIWTVTATAMWLLCWFYKGSRGLDKDSRLFLRGVLVCGLFYILFMVTVDVPMYYRRWMADVANNTTFASLAEGLREMAKCNIVTQRDSYWKEIPWMSGYFTAGVWITLWIAHAHIPDKRPKCD